MFMENRILKDDMFENVTNGIQAAKILASVYPFPKTELTHTNEYELAVSVMLSAQTTDKKVNQVTPKLFSKYPNWESLAGADVLEVQNIIHAVNFYIGKGERLVKAAQYIVTDLGGCLPHTIKDLVKISGIARKSANVITQELWNIAEGIVVDTHVTRVSQRLGLTANSDPIKIEKDLMRIIPKKYWRNFSGAAVLHGRYICVARKPKCGECKLNVICPSAFKV
jgi:endonuclease-3